MRTRIKSFSEYVGEQSISEGLKYHINNDISITESVYRPGSPGHIKLLSEARSLFKSGSLKLSLIDSGLFEATDLGLTDIYNGREVPLDLPIEDDFIVEVEKSEQKVVCAEGKSSDMSLAKKKAMASLRSSKDFQSSDIADEAVTQEEGVFVYKIYCKPKQITESEYKGRDVELNRPMRGGSKKYVVYVKNPSTGNVKKIQFGDPGLSAKVSNPKARKSFAARHKCAEKKDRTKAGYWACRINKYAHLWGGKTYPGYW
jgi:hypothetical protein